MFANETFVSILFKLINFGVIIGLAVYFYKKYALAMVHEQISQKKHFNAFLELAQSKALEQKEHVLTLQASQDRLHDQLLEKARLWRTQHEKALEIQKKEHVVCKNNLTRAFVLRREAIVRDRVIARVMPRVVDQAQQQLKEHFAHENGERFVMDIIHYMKKGSS